ncbi:transposase family protein [Tanacetum coccineum]
MCAHPTTIIQQEFCKDGKDNIEEELAKTKKENLEGKNLTRFGFMDKYSVGELTDLSFRLGLKINQVKARIEFLKSKKISKFKKLDGRDSLKMPLNTPNPITIMTCINQNNNNFESDHGVESSESSNPTTANRYKPLMLMGQNLLGHDSDSMASTMTKDDDNIVSNGAIQPKFASLLLCEVKIVRMDRSIWMYEIGHSEEAYVKCVLSFLQIAEANRVKNGDLEICRKRVRVSNENDNNDSYNNNDSYDNNDSYNINGSDINESFEKLKHMFRNMEGTNDDNVQEKLQKLFDDAIKPLYNGCTKFSILNVVVKLFNSKAKHGWSDVSFTELLEVLHEIFPNDNKLPISLYQAKKIMSPMGLEIEIIHACPNDCMLYRGVYADLHKCVTCRESRYKSKQQKNNNVNKKQKNKNNEDKVETNDNDDAIKIGPPAKQLWYIPIIPRLKQLFANEKDAKLLRWHAEGRKRDGKLRHVADSPQWRKIDNNLISVEVYDAYRKEKFQLRAMIFCTISDFPAYGNLSGYSTKGKLVCPVCEDQTSSRWLPNCRKTVFMRHRRSLEQNHRYQKKKEFDGKPEYGIVRTRLDTKDSIFWDLEYWEHLDIRHCLDVMHIEKNVFDSLIGLLLNIPGKTKDWVNARKDMVSMGIRLQLAPEEKGTRGTYLPPACYTMSKAEKMQFCQCLHDIKGNDKETRIKELTSVVRERLDALINKEKEMKANGSKETLGSNKGEQMQKVSMKDLESMAGKIMADVKPEMDELRADIATLKKFSNGMPSGVSGHITVDRFDEIECCDVMTIHFGMEVKVGKGIIYPTNVHGVPMEPGYMKIHVDMVYPRWEGLNVPRPTDKVIFLGDATKDAPFNQWPKNYLKTGYILDSLNRDFDKKPSIYSLIPLIEAACHDTSLVEWNWNMVKDGKDNIEGELAKTKKDNLEGKYPTRFSFMDKHSVGELKELRIGLGLKINQVEKLDGRDSLKMPPNTHNPITIMASIDHNNINSFGSDHGVESFRSSNANVENGSSNSMASAMRNDDDNSLYNGTIELEVHGLDSKGFLKFFDCLGLRQGVEDLREVKDTTRSTYLVNRSPSPAIGFKNPIDMLGFFGWLASIKQGTLELVKVKCIFLGYRKGDHTFEVEPQENVNQGFGLQEVQTQDLIDYQLARDMEQHLACELCGYREDRKEAAFVLAIVDKIYAHESLTFNDTVACEGSLSRDCDVEKNGKWSCIYAVGSQEYQMVCTRLDVASANLGSLKANLQHMEALSTTEVGYMTFIKAWNKEIWLQGLLIESRYKLRLVAGIATGVVYHMYMQ